MSLCYATSLGPYISKIRPGCERSCRYLLQIYASRIQVLSGFILLCSVFKGVVTLWVHRPRWVWVPGCYSKCTQMHLCFCLCWLSHTNSRMKEGWILTAYGLCLLNCPFLKTIQLKPIVLYFHKALFHFLIFITNRRVFSFRSFLPLQLLSMKDGLCIEMSVGVVWRKKSFELKLFFVSEIKIFLLMVSKIQFINYLSTMKVQDCTVEVKDLIVLYH